jgi:starch synthase
VLNARPPRLTRQAPSHAPHLMSTTIAFVAEGDANTADCWSGSGRGFVEALRGTGATVDVFDAELRSWPRAVTAALSYHPSRARWRQRYGLGSLPFRVRSGRVDHLLGAARHRYDAVVQVGATFVVGTKARRGAPYILYCDSNLAYARRGAPYSAASRLGARELESALGRERRVYDAADRIWTMSDAVGRSFRDDFGQQADKLVTIYAGANNAPSVTASSRKAARILFIGKDHERKGSELLLRAFRRVREAVPEAELHFVGGVPPGGGEPGVIRHGVVTRATPAGRQLLDELFGSAAVFCMPSRYEPFGIAFVEAMRAGLACVGVASWAMPEIIEEGATGWLVPDGSEDVLTRTLVTALRDPELCARLGARGRDRSLALFTWERVAERALHDLERLRASRVPLVATAQ